MIKGVAARLVLLSIAASGMTPAVAQSGLAGLDIKSLGSALQQRMDGAIAIANSPEARRSTDHRFDMAVEAKTQCGIAYAFTRSKTKDAASIAACEELSAKLGAGGAL